MFFPASSMKAKQEEKAKLARRYSCKVKLLFSTNGKNGG
jgi:hypothetical protein